MKNCDLCVENAVLGLPPRAAFSRPRSQFFTIQTSQPANNIHVYLCEQAFNQNLKSGHPKCTTGPSQMISILGNIGKNIFYREWPSRMPVCKSMHMFLSGINNNSSHKCLCVTLGGGGGRQCYFLI